ncbi:MAG: serine protease, partial [Pseudomonadota bacterium]
MHMKKVGRVVARGLLALSVSVPASVVALSFTGTPIAIAQDGPRSLADLSDRLIDSVVNISTSQSLSGGERNVPTPEVPDGSPFQEFFDDFFESPPGGSPNNRGREVNSLGSGFVVDAEEGIIITNNHVIADADEVVANFNDGS